MSELTNPAMIGPLLFFIGVAGMLFSCLFNEDNE